MIRYLQSSWTASLVGAVAYLATLVLVWRPVARAPIALSDAVIQSAGPSWVFQNPEMDLLIAELKRQKEALVAREKDLNELAQRLQIEQAELVQLTQAVHQVQADFDQNITRVRAEETTNLKRLAKTYAAMSPEGAAAVFRALDDGTLVKVLTFMKDPETAAILEALAKQGASDAKRVAEISERLRLALPEVKKASAS